MGRDGPLAQASPSLAQLLAAPPCKPLMLSRAPKPSGRTEGVLLPWQGQGQGRACGW